MPHVFYRIVQGDPATEDDFKSNFAKGRPPRGTEIRDSEQYRSISVFALLKDALAIQSRFPALGTHVAEVELPDDETEITIYKRPDDPLDSHFSLRGEPTAFLQCVRRLIICEAFPA